jgi:hypothetical protein
LYDFFNFLILIFFGGMIGTEFFLFFHQVIKAYQKKKKTLVIVSSVMNQLVYINLFACDIYNYHNTIASSKLQC